jgi:hypothetical protein
MHITKLILSFALTFFVGDALAQSFKGGDNRPPEKGAEQQQGGEDLKTEVMPANDAEGKAAVEEASNQLAGMCEVNGDFWAMCSKRGIKGEFVLDITIQGKGNVVTVFMVSSNATIDYQIALKNRLIELTFRNIKLPKTKRVKFRYTLNLNC